MTARALQARPPALRSSVDLLISDWNFQPSPASLQTRRLRVQHRIGARIAAPASIVFKPVAAAPRWNMLFLFLPNGTLDQDQCRILQRIRALSGRLLIVFAAPTPTPPTELDKADALIWKDLPGFDFSAYAIGLKAIADHSSGATVFVQNDSVLGPFGDVDMLVSRAPWDLTGFIASAAVQNHICSFAFVVRDVTARRLEAIDEVLPSAWCYNDFASVVLCQETRFAGLAASQMSVGAFWYLPVKPVSRPFATRIRVRFDPSIEHSLPVDVTGDATLGTPLALLDRGFPFLKRSLFGKFAHLADRPALDKRLAELGW